MPQMAPMYWTMLFFLFVMLFLMFNMIIYFFYKYNKFTFFKKINMNQLIWKW